MIMDRTNTFYWLPPIPHKTHRYAFTEYGFFILNLSLLREKAVIKNLTKITYWKVTGSIS